MQNNSEKQKNLFLNSEGNEWYNRNRLALDESNDAILRTINHRDINCGKTLEIGCSNGYRLNLLNEQNSGEFFGIDPSELAIREGGKKYGKISLQVGTADNLPFENESLDLIIYGFCLYLCDREDLFKIASEGDRVLKDGGVIIIRDFLSDVSYFNNYSHLDGVKSFKTDNSKMFLWNPSYKLFHREVGRTSGNPQDNTVCVDVLVKNKNAYIKNPFV